MPINPLLLTGQANPFPTYADARRDEPVSVLPGFNLWSVTRYEDCINILRDPVGDGWTLVGDAGFTEDPIAAHGITDALRDAELCAQAIDIGLRNPDDAAEALGVYRATRDRFARALLKATVPLAEFDWDGPQASRLLREIGDVADAECELLANRPAFVLA